MGLQVPNRVHIFPVGHERSRVVESVKRYKADKVVLITHSSNDEAGDECLSKVNSDLEELGFNPEVKICDIFDLYDSLETFASTIHENEGENVFVNISTGSKVTAIAGMIAAMVQDATAYYVKARSYERMPEEIESEFEIPHYPIQAPDEEQVIVMEYIHRCNEEGESPTKGDLIFFCDQNGLPSLRKNIEGKGKYRILDTQILDPLVSQGWVEITKSGRTKVAKVTDSGYGALRAFRHLIEMDGIEWNPDEN